MEVFLKQEIRTEYFEKHFSLKFLPREDSHKVKLTVLQSKIEGCYPNKAGTIPMFSAARTVYYVRRTIDGDKTKSLVTVIISF